MNKSINTPNSRKAFTERLKIANKTDEQKTASGGYRFYRNITPKAVSRARADISTWKSALRTADSIENPRRTRLINLYKDILDDAHLCSQLELRKNTLLLTPFSFKTQNKEEIEGVKNKWLYDIIGHILDSRFFGYSLIELGKAGGKISAKLIPRENVVPEKGEILLCESDSSGIEYRDTIEYGKWLLEIDTGEYGLLNKSVPHILLKRFAQSCWGELCEIYGIPPRYIKTDTSDSEALDRSEKMMKDMGAAAWFIIDKEEDFQFAKGADTNGDVYNNFITLCKNEVSMLITGAVVGQDTRNGNRSKEESSIKLTEKLTDSDKVFVEMIMNEVVVPALISIGILPPGAVFLFEKEENLEKLWEMVKGILPYKEVPSEFIREKFGIDCSDQDRNESSANLSSGFFD